MNQGITKQRLEAVAQRVGLTMVGSNNVPVRLTRDAEYLQSWIAAGHGADMDYLRRSLKHCSDLDPVHSGVASVVSFAVRYSQRPHPPLPEGHGRIARYAWGRDYHLVLNSRLRKFVAELSEEVGFSVPARVGADAIHILERALGRAAGLGFVGKNSMLIRPRMGSYFVLGEVLLGVKIQEALTVLPAGGAADGGSGCGSCTRCLTTCPTAAFVGPQVLDARRCISYLSIEKRGVLTKWERQALSSWLFGCDECQDVCPFNHAALKGERGAGEVEFEPAGGVGPTLSLTEVLTIPSHSTYQKRFVGTALTRAGRPQLIRNALVVAVNTRASGALLLQIEQLAKFDRSSLVRQTALWAYWHLENYHGSLAPRRFCLRDLLLQDVDAAVRKEAQELEVP